MGRRRNRNKADREDYAVFCSSSRNKNVTEVDVSDGSDADSCTTRLTLEDDMRSVITDDDNDEDSLSDTCTLSDHLGEFLDNAAEKNISIRLAALDNVRTLLTKRYMALDMEKWTATLIDVIDKALRKTDEEAMRAAVIAALISFQLGEEVSDDLEDVVNFLRHLCMDPTRNVHLRSQCARSLALCTFLSLEQPASIQASVEVLRSIWCGTKSSAASAALFCAAVSGWSLLLEHKITLVDFQGGREVLRTALMDEPKLSSFLSGAQLDMRLRAGEALAVLYEAAVAAYGDDYRFPNQEHLLDMFGALATDSLKFRAKKDRRTQRFTFRQMYTVIKDQEAPVFAIRFGNETLNIDSCGKKLLYEFACGVLHSGINTHLKLNPPLRERFDLGPVTESSAKISKTERVAMQNAISKTRDLQRLKQRDKRIAS